MEKEEKKRRLIFTSKGLGQKIGVRKIASALKDDNLTDKRIFLVGTNDSDIDHLFVQGCIKLEFSKKNIIMFDKDIGNIPTETIDFIYVTEGNTFQVLNYMRKNHLIEPIKKWFAMGADYIGASAGAIIAGIDIELAKDFDKNYVGMTDFTALGLFDGTIIPHYTQKELQRYKANTPKEIVQRYHAFYSVSQEGVKIVEV